MTAWWGEDTYAVKNKSQQQPNKRLSFCGWPLQTPWLTCSLHTFQPYTLMDPVINIFTEPPYERAFSSTLSPRVNDPRVLTVWKLSRGNNVLGFGQLAAGEFVLLLKTSVCFGTHFVSQFSRKKILKITCRPTNSTQLFTIQSYLTGDPCSKHQASKLKCYIWRKLCFHFYSNFTITRKFQINVKMDEIQCIMHSNVGWCICITSSYLKL